MKEVTLYVPNISCEHCVNSITKATSELGAARVQVNLSHKQVYLAYDPTKVSLEQLEATIREEGYDITGQIAGCAITS